MTESADPRAVVDRYLHDVLAGADPQLDRTIVANTSLLDRVRAFRRAFGDVEITSQVMVADQELVAVAFSTRATHRGTFQGVEATGRKWTATSCGIFRVAAGRIVDFWVTSDRLAILEQLGAVQRGPGSSA